MTDVERKGLNKKVAALMGVSLKPETDCDCAIAISYWDAVIPWRGESRRVKFFDRDDRLTLWTTRQLKSYQGALEKFVANFEFDAPDYSRDPSLSLTVIELLRPAWTWICFDGDSAGRYGFKFSQRGYSVDHLAYSDIFAEAVCLAALQTVEADKEGPE